MKIKSSRYDVRLLSEKDIVDIEKVYASNDYYFECMKEPYSVDSIIRDLTSTPPGKDMDDKYYYGFYDKDNIVAVLDLIEGYPQKLDLYIGLFMVHGDFSKKGIGHFIINEVIEEAKKEKYKNIKLGIVVGNRPSEKFWESFNFLPMNKFSKQENYTISVLKKEII